MTVPASADLNLEIPAEICQELPWDSRFFGIRIARYNPSHLTDQSAAGALAFCGDRQVDCLYLLLADGAVANACGFHHVDTILTLSRDVSHPPVPAARTLCRIATPGDLPALREIARISHRDSRFYSDPNFDRARCDALYEEWIDRSCQGWARRTFVAEHQQRASGYITCNLSGDGVGSIGLFAVAEHARGRGLGKDLIATALAYFRHAGMRSVDVATQLRNTPAQQIYQRCEFAPVSQMLWFHAWFKHRNT